jgi:hypothetical protein
MTTPIELYAKAEKVALQVFAAEFSTFESSAFRAEFLPQYIVQEEKEALSLFLRGQVDPPKDLHSDWKNIITSARSRGARMSRVRLVPQGPCEYLKFEINWAYLPHSSLGEEIGFVFSEDLNDENSISVDYWLFDERRCYLMIYDLSGRFMGVLKISDPHVTYFVENSKNLTQRSTSLTEVISRKMIP